MATEVPATPTGSSAGGLTLETRGIEVVEEADRKGRPRDLFWPWFAANVSVLGIAYGAFILAFGVSFWQAVLAAVVGTVFSFLLVGLVALSGKWASAPTMIVSRAAFGVRGNALPTAVSYVLLVGWETALTALATLATATVFNRLGAGGGNATKVVAFLVVAAVVVGAGVLGFDVILRLQTVLTVVLGVLTVVYMILTAKDIHWNVVSSLPAGSGQAVLGALVFAMTGFGLGWVNAGGDYSRYLPRSASGRGVVWWTTFGGSIAPIILVLWGLLLAGSSPELAKSLGADPIGALTTLLPTWFLIPFALVAVGGLIAGAVLDIYSSGLNLLTLGVRIPRYVAAGIDGVLMILGTIYVVWIAKDFLGPFQGFLITLGVPMAAWCGVFLADLWLRRGRYAESELFSPADRYGAVNAGAVGTMVVATVVGWGLVTNSFASWLSWQGYLLGPFGLGGKEGAWAFANLGVLVALVLGAVGYALTSAGRVRRQEPSAAGTTRRAGLSP
ncbi:MAG: purine-cytosine permease family protein [Kineosporiaceae bacterium]